MENGRRIAADQMKQSQSTMVVKGKDKKAAKVPERYMAICQGNRCEIKEVNPRGIGIGRVSTANWTPI